jgi:galacturan 1,4-alpha-galacturonidase
VVSDNTVSESVYGLRIKTVRGATNASGKATVHCKEKSSKCTNFYSIVKNIVYSGNQVSGITYQGIAIEQDYGLLFILIALSDA